ncbi:MAG: DUF188 domain-containing protein [Treponema sp.]|jgi:uncharacterized protein YaiI (UPF0178 family)|nr:DUF188 domain-containing protein [Treponema sp.]
MRIFVDADSCPRLARELVIRAAKRLHVQAVFAANKLIPGVKGEFLAMELCPDGPGTADDYIVEQAREGDLAITRDVPLAARLTANSVSVIDDRGRVFDRNNIGQLLSLRDFQVQAAENGLGVPRFPNYGKRELKTFADSFDRLTRKLSIRK